MLRTDVIFGSNICNPQLLQSVAVGPTHSEKPLHSFSEVK